LMEKSGCRYEWRRERNWGRTFSTYLGVIQRLRAALRVAQSMVRFLGGGRESAFGS
jgi:hypothetical protein